MKHFKQLAALLLMLMIILGTVTAVSAYTTVTMSGFTFYTNDDGEAVIVGYDDNSSRVEIPYTLLGANVTEIANNAFWEDSYIQELSFDKASALRRIGSSAFYNCTALTSVTLPCLDELGFGAFRGCTGLKTLCINEGLNTVSAQAFDSCESLTSVTFADSIKSIGEYAFRNCNSLKSVTIPDSVTDIGDYAFGYSYNDSTKEYVKVENFKIFGSSGTAAETYAGANGFDFEPLTKDISSCTLSGIKTKTYNGKAHTQSVTVKDGSTVLSADTDYTVEYANNVNAGTATLTVKGKGGYTGTLTATFKINKAANPITVKVTAKTVKLSALKKKAQTVKAIAVSKAQGKVSYKLTSVPKTLKKLVKISSKGVITVSKWAKAKKGAYKIKVKITAAGGKNYNTKSFDKTVTVKVN